MSGLRYLYFYFVWWCPTHIVLCFVFLRLVLPMLPVSLDCPFFIFVISNVYLIKQLICIPSVHRMGVIDRARKK